MKYRTKARSKGNHRKKKKDGHLSGGLSLASQEVGAPQLRCSAWAGRGTCSWRRAGRSTASAPGRAAKLASDRLDGCPLRAVLVLLLPHKVQW